MIAKIGRLCGGLLLCILFAASPAHAAKLEIGKPAPDFRVTTFDGKTVKLADLKGQVVVLNIWATWCAPCKVELPLIDGYYRAAKQFGLSVIAVTTEDSVPNEYLKPLAKAMAVPLAHHLRGGGYDEVRAVPTNYVIDRNGVLRYAKAGAFNLDLLNEVLVPLLNEPAPNAAPGLPASVGTD